LARPPHTTRTLGPLHLEDLEPHRFEDLIRQLIYDFRSWRALEATGRAGSDDGFDARAWEIVPSAAASDDTDDDDERINDRQWLVQCKRERSITPKKLGDFIEAIPAEERAGLYGMIFAAACDFSKTSRDLFREKARELGFSEAYLWGKGEIEDFLFQPKNDHLLFAYFGISLQARRRSIRSDVRARLAAKRKVKRLASDSRHVLVRDVGDDRYPYLDDDESKDREDRGRWRVYEFAGCNSDGVHLKLRAASRVASSRIATPWSPESPNRMAASASERGAEQGFAATRIVTGASKSGGPACVMSTAIVAAMSGFTSRMKGAAARARSMALCSCEKAPRISAASSSPVAVSRTRPRAAATSR